MAMKVDQAAAVDPHGVQTTVSTSTSSTVSASGTKVSMFGAKSGFVIPKNKLSGSLVPIFRGGGKADASESTKEDTTKQVQRKTKWGIDMTQDAAVRRGRALAYQLQKLELLELEKREVIGEILQLIPNYKAPPDYKPLLKEAKVPIPLKTYPGYNFIGLILGPESNTQKRLEEETGAKICVHGTKADTGEKREITLSDADEAQGAYEELYVHVSADTFQKVDAAVALVELLVTPVSGNAVAVSTTSTLISGNNGDAFGQSQDSATGFTLPVSAVNQGVVQPMVGPAQAGPPQLQFHPYPGPWHPHGLPQTPMRPSGFIPAPSSGPMPNNSFRFPPMPINPFNAPPFYGARPPGPAGFGQIPRNSSPVVSGLQPPLQRPYMVEPRPLNQAIPPGPLQNYSILGPQPQPAYPANPSRPSPAVMAPFTGNPPVPAGQTPAARPPVHSMPQPVATSPLGPPPSNRPLMSMPVAGNSSGWSGPPPNTPPPFRPPNMMQMAPPSVPPQRPLPGVPPAVSGPPQQNMPGTAVSRPPAPNGVPPPVFPSRPSTPQLPTTPVNHPAIAPASSFGPPHTGSHPPPILSSPPIRAPSVASTSAAPAPSPTPPLLRSPAPRPLSMPASTAAPPPVLGQAPPSIQSSSARPMQPVMARAPVPIPSPSSQPAVATVSGSLPSFSTIKPPMPNSVGVPPVTAPKPQRPSSSDFTFQPQRPQTPTSQNVPRPTSQPVSHNAPMPLSPGIQPPVPQAPSFRPAANNSAPPIGMPGFPRPQIQAPIPSPPTSSAVPFTNQSTVQSQPRHPTFLNPRLGPATTPAPQMGPPSHLSGSQVPSPSGPLPVQPRNQLPLTNRPGSVMVPNQQFGNSLNYAAGRPTSSPGGNQIYDPFSPTSISLAPPQQGGAPVKSRKPDADTEYEDLMASVGVR
ncbi:proline-rich extensin-like protein EPR1 isoform X2 [Magnolia sinica]|uniref:proline-rich extensin-like protein EPR1 isoform X2 n=1 Tax=Magnolia sinica TaxID=86752 RepID=UPI002659EE09|nr:proline-rich extensin-like protein EPR1 isoform X2 [Magnolia sinica]